MQHIPWRRCVIADLYCQCTGLMGSLYTRKPLDNYEDISETVTLWELKYNPWFNPMMIKNVNRILITVEL